MNSDIRTKCELIRAALQALIRKRTKKISLIWQAKFNYEMILTIKNSGN